MWIALALQAGNTAALPDQFFTPADILSVGVATVAVTVAAKALHAAFTMPPAKTAFAASLVLAYAAVYFKTAPSGLDWLMAFFNACLLFCSSAGVNEFAVGKTTKPGEGIAGKSPLFTSWFKPA